MSDWEVYLVHNSVIMLLLPFFFLLLVLCTFTYAFYLKFQELFMQFLSNELLKASWTSDEIPGNLVFCSWLRLLWLSWIFTHATFGPTFTYTKKYIPIWTQTQFLQLHVKTVTKWVSWSSKWLSSVFGNDIIRSGIFHCKWLFWIVPTCSESNVLIMKKAVVSLR